MIAEIISVGTELLLGHADTNSSFLAGELARYGIDLYRISQVGDNLGRLSEAVSRACGRSRLVLMTGGLGPTEDDLTREAVAAALGESIALDPDEAREIEVSYRAQGRPLPMPPGRRKQASRISSAVFLPNRRGTAPGWFVVKGETILATMPGVPVEMTRMWREEIVPRLKSAGIITHTIHSRTLKLLGIGESLVEETIRDLVHSTKPTVATYATRTGVHVRITAKAPSVSEAEAIIAPVEEEIRRRLDPHIYGSDKEEVAAAVRRLLQRLGLTLATVEVAGGGSLCAALSDEEYSSPYRGGIVLSATEEAAPTGLSESGDRVRGEGQAPRLETLARRARTLFGAQVGLVMALGPESLADSQGKIVSFSVALETPEGFQDDQPRLRCTTPEDTRRRMALGAVAFLRSVLLAPGHNRP